MGNWCKYQQLFTHDTVWPLDAQDYKVCTEPRNGLTLNNHTSSRCKSTGVTLTRPRLARLGWWICHYDSDQQERSNKVLTRNSLSLDPML